MHPVTTIRNGETRWIVRTDVAEPFRRLVEETLSTPDGRASLPVLKENLARTVYRLPFPTDHGEEIIFKEYRITHWDQHLRYLLRPSKARAEWRVMRRLRDGDFPTATPVAFAETRRRGVLGGCSFASVAIPEAVPFPDRFREVSRAGPQGRETLIRSLARLVGDLHRQGAYHRDLHVGNVLVAGEGLHLVDLHRTRFPFVLTRRQRRRDLTKLCHSLTFLAGEEEIRLLVSLYAESDGGEGGADAILAEVLRGVRRLERERIRSRSLRCVKVSSAFRRTRLAGGILYHRRVWPEEVLRAARTSHQEAATGGERLLKASERSRVTRVETPKGPVVVKEYLYPRWTHLLENLVRWSPARRAYIAGRGLEEVHVPTPEVVGLVEERRLGVVVRSLLFTRFVPGEPLEEAIGKYNDPESRNALASKRRAFLREFAAAVRRIHDAEVYQPDMAGQNFLVAEEEGKRIFYLLDLDRVRLPRPITEAHRRRSLSQIGHMPGTITRADRLHFLRAYAGGDSDLVDRETVRLLAEMIDRKAVDQARRIARILRKQSRE